MKSENWKEFDFAILKVFLKIFFELRRYIVGPETRSLAIIVQNTLCQMDFSSSSVAAILNGKRRRKEF